jgi:hypothetical protein
MKKNLIGRFLVAVTVADRWWRDIFGYFPFIKPRVVLTSFLLIFISQTLFYTLWIRLVLMILIRVVFHFLSLFFFCYSYNSYHSPLAFIEFISAQTNLSPVLFKIQVFLSLEFFSFLQAKHPYLKAMGEGPRTLLGGNNPFVDSLASQS